MMQTYKSYLLILTILFFAIISRSIIFDSVYKSTPQSVVRFDTVRYEAPAVQLLKTGTLAINPQQLGTPTLGTTPMYSIFIAGVYKLFGQNHYYLILLQLLLSALSILVIYKTAARLWSSDVGILAAGLMTLEPLQLLYSQLIMSETLFVFFMSFALFSAVNLLSERRHCYRWAFLLGLMLTAATMTRPISYYLAFALIIGISIYRKKLNYSWKKLATIIALILLPLLSITEVWMARNGLLTGVYELNNAKSKTMLYWKAKGVVMIKDSLSANEAAKIIQHRLPDNIATVKQESDAEKALAKEIILNNLGAYLELSAKGVVDLLLGPGLSSQAMYYDHHQKGKKTASENSTGGYKLWYICLIIYSAFFTLMTYLFSSYGLYQALKHSTPRVRVAHLLMLGVVFYFIIISTGHIAADSRMRVPIIPIFLLYSAFGMHTLIKKIKSRTSKKIQLAHE